MKTTYKLTTLLLSATVMIYSCNKSNQVNPVNHQQQKSSLPTTADGKHVYGLLPTSREKYMSLPTYSPELFNSQFSTFSIGKPAVVTIAEPLVRDQGTIGSCTAFAGCSAYAIGRFYKTGSWTSYYLSPAFLYYAERVEVENEPISADDGASMWDIGQALTRYGHCTESMYPYPSNDYSTAYNTPPSSADKSNALSYKTTSFTRVNDGDTAAVKNLLRNHVAVMLGFNIYENKKTGQYFENLNTTNYTYDPLTSSGAFASGATSLGGHADTIIGYDDNR